MTYHPDVRLEFATATDAGVVRPHNEDSIMVSPQFGLAVLADGMGGYNAGEVAASIATAGLRREIEAALTENPDLLLAQEPDLRYQWLQARINQVNFEIFEAARTQQDCAGMGTTLVMALFHNNRVLIGHVGDSRLYRLRQKHLDQITRDHSLLQAEIDAGIISPEQARHAAYKNLVTRALGVAPSVYADVQELDTEAGDYYLLCSDGLTDMALDAAIQDILQKPQPSLTAKAHQLIALANRGGGRDNISVILIKVVRHAGNRRVEQLTTWLKKTALVQSLLEDKILPDTGGMRWQS
jgi:serine/threonine protein phosphatase PrpC